MQNLKILALDVQEISLGSLKFKVGHVTKCHPYAEIDIAYMHAKLEQTSFSRTGDMVGAHQNLNG